MNRRFPTLLIVLIILLNIVPIPSSSSQILIPQEKIEPLVEAAYKNDKLSISKWDGLSTIEVSTPTVEGYQYDVHELEKSTEIDIILSSPPKTNIFYYPTVTKNADFYYQPAYTELTPEDSWGFVNETHVFNKKGELIYHRPKNIVGSYAIYGPYKNNEYGTGKIAHVYRPKIIDSLGDWVWGELNYDGKNLTVTVDKEWLEKANYPVRVDPNFGYEGEGASTHVLSTDYMVGSLHTSPSGSVTVTSLTAYCHGSGVNFKGVIVLHSTLEIITDGVSDSVGGTVSDEWTTATYSDQPVITSSTEYVLMMVVSDQFYLKYDAGSANQGHTDTTNSYASPTDPTDASHTTNKYSLYVTYYNGIIDSATITDLDDTDNCYAMKQYYTVEVNVSNNGGAEYLYAISVRGLQSSTVRWQVNATDLNATPSYSLVTGSNIADLDSGSCSFTEDGTTGSLSLKVRFEWDYTEENDCEIAVWASDNESNTVGWDTIQTDYFDVITILTTYQFGANNTSPAVSSPILISGYVRYSLVAGGTNSSSSYPPDAQFTAVRVYDDEEYLQGTDTSIVNGYFAIEITSSAILETVYYYAYLDLVADYTDGDAPDGDLVYVTTTASFYVVDQIKQAFELYNLTWTTITTMLTSMADYWTTAAQNVLSFFVNVITLVSLFATSIIYWLNLFVTFFVNFFTICGNIINGTHTLQTGLGDMWDLIGFATWVGIVPVVVFLLWFDSLGDRARKTGRSEIKLIVEDLQIVSYIVNEAFNWSYQVFNFMVNMLISLASLLVG